jgi:hypothetical protein
MGHRFAQIVKKRFADLVIKDLANAQRERREKNERRER